MTKTKKRSRGCSNYDWSKEKTAQLIKYYKTKKDLWDPSSKLYSDR